MQYKIFKGMIIRQALVKVKSVLLKVENGRELRKTRKAPGFFSISLLPSALGLE